MHRLKLYLTGVALVLSVLYLLQVLPMKSGSPDRENGIWSDGRWGNSACKLISFSLMYTDWVMLLLICWLILYLFRLAQCIGKPLTLFHVHHQVLFEAAVIAFTFTLPLLFVWAPFVTDLYGVGSMMWCGIVIERNCGDTRQGLGILIGIWYLPAAVIALLCTVGVIIVISLFWKYYKRQGLTRQMSNAIMKGVPPVTYLVLYNTINCIDISSLIYHNSSRGSWKRNTDYHLWITHAITGPGRALIIPFAFVLSQALIRCCLAESRRKRDTYNRL